EIARGQPRHAGAIDGGPRLQVARAHLGRNRQTNAVAVGDVWRETELHAVGDEVYPLQAEIEVAADDRHRELTAGLEVRRLPVESHEVRLGQRAGVVQIAQGVDRQRGLAVVQAHGKVVCRQTQRVAPASEAVVDAGGSATQQTESTKSEAGQA